MSLEELLPLAKSFQKVSAVRLKEKKGYLKDCSSKEAHDSPTLMIKR